MKKTMKKIIAVLLAVAMLIPIASIMSSAAITLVWPVPDSKKINQGYHSGCAIDIGDSSSGNAKVVSATSGTVKNVFKCTQQHAGSSMGSNGVKCDGFGTGVVIQGPDGRFYGYAHMKANSIPSNIYVGATVTAGQQIGNIGSTGNSTGNHLHFQITTGNYYNTSSNINPAKETYTYSTTNYTITYNANGGSGAPSQETGTTNFVISSIKPTRKGYTFLGWSESSSATSASYTSGDIVFNINKNITLYAVWRKNVLNVYYNVNGASITSDTYKKSSDVIYKVSDSTKYYQKWVYNTTNDGGLVNASTFGIYKTGYTFAGWGTKISGGTIFDPHDNTILPTDLNANIKNGDYSITLYAQWKPNSLNIYYNANGGSISSDTYKLNSNIIYNKSDSSKYCHSWTYNSAKPNGLINVSTFGLSKEGYTFAGWGTTSSGGTIFDQDDTSLVPTDLNANIKNGDYSITLYAIWEKKTYKVSYDANGGTDAPAAQTKIYGTTLKLSTVKPQKTGYTFSGWNTKSDGTGTGYAAGANYTANSAVTLYAVWKKVSTGTKPAAPVVSISSTSVTEGDSVTLTWTAVSNVTNYWVTGFKGEERVMGEIDNSRSKTLKLEAGTYDFSVVAINSYGETTGNWVRFTVYKPQPTTYTLTYNSNGGSGAPSSQTGATSYTISSTKPTRSGYTFLGWSTNSSATSASYVAGNTISLSSNTTLYAVWNKNANTSNDNIKITIRNNPGTMTLNYGDTVRIYADAHNLPAGAKIGWYVNDGSTIKAKVSSDNTYCEITATGSGTVTLAAKAVDANGNVMTDSQGNQIGDVQKINTKSSIWFMIVSFFKNLFGSNRTTVQFFKNVF